VRANTWELKIGSGLAGATLLVLAACGGTASPASGTAASPATSTAAAGSAAAAKPAAASAAAKPSAAAKAETFRLATGSTTPSTMFVWLAQDTGVFAKNGVDVKTEGMTGQVQMDSVISGDAEGTVHTGADLVFTSEAQGADLRVVLTGSAVDNDLLVAGPEIKTVQDLKGKKVAEQSLTSGNGQMMNRLLTKEGLQAGKDYQVVVTGSASQTSGVLAAVLAHQVDATAVPPAVAAESIKQGKIHVLVDLAKRSDLPTGSQVFALQTKYVQQHHDTVQKVVDSLITSVRTIKTDKAAAEDELKKRYKLTEQGPLDEEYQRQTEVLAKDPTPKKEQFQDVIAAFPKDIKPLSDDQINTILDTSFVEDAMKRGLTNY
jgi:NitT/TauT family transport system substrate-binding protein